jgi:hypothetical protein
MVSWVKQSKRGVPLIYELREYKAVPGKLPLLLKRFETQVSALMEKHGIRILGFWTTLIGPAANVALHYMVEWESLAEREQKWGAFASDPEWIRVRDESEKDGPYVAELSSSILAPTSFSRLK